jgi:hypothetical protein
VLCDASAVDFQHLTPTGSKPAALVHLSDFIDRFGADTHCADRHAARVLLVSRQ